MNQPIRVTVWNEYRHEKNDEHVSRIYPDGLHNAIGAHLKKQSSFEVRTATLDEPEHGLTTRVMADTDVLIWWGHAAHADVRDDVVDRIHGRVLDGMGLVCLHSAHYSKIFMKLMGTSCSLKWRESGEKERIWTVAPGHPIAEGLDEQFVIEHAEMYGEPFDIPEPDTLVFISWFPGGEVFRSGCCFYRGRGRVFYFRPGHETHPIYYDANALRVIANAVRWTAPVNGPQPTFGNVKPPETD